MDLPADADPSSGRARELATRPGDAATSDTGSHRESPWRTALRWGLTTAALVLAGWLVVLAAQRTVSGPDQGMNNRVIVSQVPLPNAQAPRQSEVGVELLPGYDGRLTINGTRIPEGELVGAIDPTSVSKKDLDKYGLRPNNRNRIFFRPGPGKVLDALPKGRITLTVEYHKERNVNQGAGSASWTVEVQ